MVPLIFDLDGTLLDTAPDIHRAGNEALAGFGAAGITLDVGRGFVGRGARVYVQRLMEATGFDQAAEDALLAAFLARYEGAVGLTRPYPGMIAALDRLAGRGHRLGLCTNKPEMAIHAVLAAFGLEGRFDAIVGGDTLTVSKPDPAPLRETMSRMGAHRCIYVGDSEVDAETARRAGCPFLLYLGGYRQAAPETLAPAASFADHADLPAIMADLTGRERMPD